MAKKQKRNVSRQSTVSRVTYTEAPAVVGEPRAATPSRNVSAEFNPDYSYVIKDLKRIGILAGSFFLVLIALSFILK